MQVTLEVQTVLSNEKIDKRHFRATCDMILCSALSFCLWLDHLGSVLLSHVPQFLRVLEALNLTEDGTNNVWQLDAPSRRS